MSQQSGRPSIAASSVPSVARVYDYLLGGKNHYATDREAAQRLLEQVPDARTIAQANRSFMRRAVRHLVRLGVRQFLDIGSGLPTAGNVHEVAQVETFRAGGPDARVIYVDNDPVVLAHGRALLATNDSTKVIQADLRNPAGILEEAREVLDFNKPVGLLLVAVVHFLTEADDPGAQIAVLRGAMAPNSYLVLSHGAPVSRRVAAAVATYQQEVNSGATLRNYYQIAALFDGFSLLEPGLVPVDDWHPEEVGTDTASAVVLGGVGQLEAARKSTTT